MKSQKVANTMKNAFSTVFLLAGAFFVCSTLLSIRSVFADPVAPVDENVVMGPQSGRANASRTGRASPRYSQASSRTTVARTAVPGGVTSGMTAPARNINARTTTNRATVNRATPSTRTNVATPAVNRNVVSRATNVRNRATATRNVRARTATTDAASNARISLQGNAIRGSKTTPTTTYSYLTNKLYTGNYSNIIDSTTGLISADAFNNCMESYYTCMDEICTARNAAQRRCACAGRVRAFAEAETALETANEELIKVSGELALLIANKGKDVTEAFQLTDAEKVMNCVSWKDTTEQYGISSDEAVEWCNNHGIYMDAGGTAISKCEMPEYCKESKNDFGFDISKIDGSGSDILASLKSWADAKEQTITILDTDEDGLLGAFENLSGVISGLGGFGGSLDSSDELRDSLAETWGYELFEYAHNNVCSRVLDSCFNGIYEACGTPPSGVRCSNGASQCPYNYNSKISVNNSGTYELNFIKPSGTTSASNSPTCYGYSNTSGDPYSNLRGPVADARRSIMQKYALDANADCDVYGEQLRTTAQNIGYQKVAAQQALQQKRLEFATEESDNILTAATTAMSNFHECLSEIHECYDETEESEENWTSSRIKTYCAQVVNVPHCYEEMICSMPSGAQFSAVIDTQDTDSCKNTQDYSTNTCRNVVTLNEILNGAYDGDLSQFTPEWGDTAKAQDSTMLREYCLRNTMGIPLNDAKGSVNETWNIRNWTKGGGGTESAVRCTISEVRAADPNARSGYKEYGDTTCTMIEACNSGYTLNNNKCVANDTDCTSEIANATSAVRVLDRASGKWGACTLKECRNGYTAENNKCVANTAECTGSELYGVDKNAKIGTKTWENDGWGICKISECHQEYSLYENKCYITEKKCDPMPDGATKATQTWRDTKYSECIISECGSGLELKDNACVSSASGSGPTDEKK